MGPAGPGPAWAAERRVPGRQTSNRRISTSIRTSHIRKASASQGARPADRARGGSAAWSPGHLVTCGPDSAARPEPRPSPASGLGALSAPGPLSGLVTSAAAVTGSGRAGPGLPLWSRQLTGSGQRSQGRCDPDAPTRGCRCPSHAAHPVTDPLGARHRPRNREARNHTDVG